MKKIKALILGSCRSSGSIFGGLFLGAVIVIWLIAAFAPSAVRSTLFIQSFSFFFLGVFGITLFALDQFIGAWVLPISGREFVTAKLIQISALLACGFLFFSAIFWGAFSFSRITWDVSVFYIPAVLFPISCTVFMLIFTLILLGKRLILLGLWIFACATPGVIGSLLPTRITALYKDLVSVFSVLARHPAGFLMALYLICAGLIFILYKLSVRNFNKLQYNRSLSVEWKR